MVRRAVRAIGVVVALSGALLLVWVAVVWLWQDPFTLYLNSREQARLGRSYEARVERGERSPAAAVPERPKPLDPRAAALAYRRSTAVGDPVGRLLVPRLGLRVIVVFGTGTGELRRGPGLDARTWFPGQGKLIYVAGHRTTYGAPFADIDDLRPGDRVTLEVPYGAFRYVVTGHRIVRADDMSALRSRGREEVALQACWPRFFASHRYIVYARLVSVRPLTAD